MNQQCGEAYLFTTGDLLRARLDALEEAAKLCEASAIEAIDMRPVFAEAIRALMEPKHDSGHTER